jgi:SAM-dependent methyltransferase
MGGLWNVNIHYDARLAGCVPASATAVLDAGCGDGFLAARLARCVPRVVAIDIDAPVLGRARARFPDVPVAWCRGDVLAYPLVPGSFDAVLSNAMFHHLPDARAGLRRLGELVRPGGTLAIVGFPALSGVTCRGPLPPRSCAVSRSGSAANGRTPRRRHGRPATVSASSARPPARRCPGLGSVCCRWDVTCLPGIARPG